MDDQWMIERACNSILLSHVAMSQKLAAVGP